jgi:nucleoid-associated protein YgaU
MDQRLQTGTDDAFATLVGRAALGAAAAAVLLLTLGLIAELLRRRHRAHRLLAVLDLTLPTGVRTVVVTALALVATLAGPRPAGAADSVRGWLGQTSATTTATTRVAVATPDSVSARDTTGSTAPPTGPVVLIPPVSVEPPESAPVAPTPTAASTPPVATSPAPTPVAVAFPDYVVRRGDCLWSIAAGLLGPRADARSIDTAWRQIYAANRAAIGDNPNLIHIGLTLELPPLTSQP